MAALGATDAYDADGSAFRMHWDRQRGSEAVADRHRMTAGKSAPAAVKSAQFAPVSRSTKARPITRRVRGPPALSRNGTRARERLQLIPLAQ